MDTHSDHPERPIKNPTDPGHKIYLLSQGRDLHQEFVRIAQELDGVQIVRQDAAVVQDQDLDADFLVVVAEDESFARRLVKEARRSLRFGTTPLILVYPGQPARLRAPYFDALITTPFSAFDLKNSFQTLSPIRANLDRVNPLSGTLAEPALREVNLLRFVFSRELSEITPWRDENSPLGYGLPWADDLLGANRADSLFELTRLAGEGLFVTELKDRVNVCPHCGDYRINYRQVCPACGSPDITTEGTIQHFSCGQVAPESNFIQKDKYICPKCGKPLKHIGVDYTKPGEVVVCQHCGHVSQEAEVSCLSLVCGETFPPDHARQISIYLYRLSQMGLEAAIQGLHSGIDLNNILKSFLNIYTLPFFEKYLDLEMLRALRYKCPFSLTILNIENIAEIEETIGLREKTNLVKELEKIFGTFLRNTDLITFAPNGNILILLIECDEVRADKTIQRIINKGKEVLAISLKFKFDIVCFPNQIKDIETMQDRLAQATS